MQIQISFYELASLALIVAILYGIKLMNSPKTAVLGNRIGALSMLIAIILVLIYNNIVGVSLIWAFLAIGGVIGYFIAARVVMIQMPQMVALFNGFGGGASLLVALVILFESFFRLSLFSRVAAQLAIITGGITLSGSLMAAGKLHGVIIQRPVVLRGHNILTTITLALLLIVGLWGALFQGFASTVPFILLTALALFFGVLFTLRVGGADMPITISLLNSLSGLAGAITGFAILDPLLVAVGAIIGSAGLILTQTMCLAMNRCLLDILTGGTTTKSLVGNSIQSQTTAISPAFVAEHSTLIPSEVAKGTPMSANSQPDIKPGSLSAALEQASCWLKEAARVVIVPGYGMALAQAQGEVKNLLDLLENKGKEVKFAIHPVAGRMPGHMNVLLAEVDVPYEQLYEMDTINPQFKKTDVAIVVGACDVINPAAIEAPGTPIYGMPILRVEQAKHVIICNLDVKPGYSGVDNPLYLNDNVALLLGNASETVSNLASAIM